jgi:aerobic-type carbon monoxide dehydrogenase small subunit (CoxS/CutS family)
MTSTTTSSLKARPMLKWNRSKNGHTTSKCGAYRIERRCLLGGTYWYTALDRKGHQVSTLDFDTQKEAKQCAQKHYTPQGHR